MTKKQDFFKRGYPTPRKEESLEIWPLVIARKGIYGRNQEDRKNLSDPEEAFSKAIP